MRVGSKAEVRQRILFRERVLLMLRQLYPDRHFSAPQARADIVSEGGGEFQLDEIAEKFQGSNRTVAALRTLVAGLFGAPAPVFVPDPIKPVRDSGLANVSAPRFNLHECREREREFVETLHRRAESNDWMADVCHLWVDRIVIAFGLWYRKDDHTMRTLRIDFDGQRVAFGPDETPAVAKDFDAVRKGATVIGDRPPAALADLAADWLEKESTRAVHEQRWDYPKFVRPFWVFGDTGEEPSECMKGTR